MKKIFCFICTMLMVVCLSSCSKETTQNAEKNEKGSGNVITKENADSKKENNKDNNASKKTESITISMGAYEQDNNYDNGSEAIEWEVVTVDGDKALVVSKYAIITKRYNKKDEAVTWENCYLREWLNEDFYDSSFTDSEKQLILESTVKADTNPLYGTSGGNDTVDKVFILSAKEYNTYYSDDADKGYEPTDCLVANGIHVYKTGACNVWLRTPGKVENSACFLFASSGVNEEGKYVDALEVGVCPAMWIDYAGYQK